MEDKKYELLTVWFSGSEEDKIDTMHCILLDKETGLKHTVHTDIKETRALYKEGTNELID